MSTEQKTLVITRKMQIACIDDKEKKQEFYAFLRSLNTKIFRIANSLMSNYYMSDSLAEILTEKIEVEQKDFWKFFGKAKKEKIKELQNNVWEMSQQNLGYNLTKDYDEIPSYIRTALSQKVFQDFGNDLIAVKQGKRTQRTYRKGIAVPFTKYSIRNLRFTEEKECFFEWFGYQIAVVFGKDKSWNLPLLQRVISEDEIEEICDSSIQISGSKVFINFCIRIPQQKKELIQDVEAVADITFLSPIFLTNNKNSEVIAVGEKTFSNLVALRNQMNNRHEKLQEALRHSRGGHGRKRKLQAETQFELKEKAVAKTENHRITKWVIDEVLRLKAKTLTITRKALSKEEQSQKFQLRYWGYANIIEGLKFKAKKYGIEVIDKTNVDTVLEYLTNVFVGIEEIDKQEMLDMLCADLELDMKTIKSRVTNIIEKKKTINEIYFLQEKGNKYALIQKEILPL